MWLSGTITIVLVVLTYTGESRNIRSGLLHRVVRQTQCQSYQSGVRVLISGQECHVAVDGIGSHICYNHWFRSRQCCERCMQLRNRANRGCEYGDRSTECRNIAARQCYVNRNRQICCDTCRRLRNNARPNCLFGDMASSCNHIPRGLCSIPENRRICCQTCLAARNNSNPTCPYGDQSSQCFQIRSIDCYSARTQQVCCDTCARLRTTIPRCPYGNRATQCGSLSAGDCYSREVRNSCCQTCRTLRTNIPGCQYGDRPVFFATAAGRMNCETYIGVYGRSYCQEDATSRRCCRSCRGVTPSAATPSAATQT